MKIFVFLLDFPECFEDNWRIDNSHFFGVKDICTFVYPPVGIQLQLNSVLTKIH